MTPTQARTLIENSLVPVNAFSFKNACTALARIVEEQGVMISQLQELVKELMDENE